MGRLFSQWVLFLLCTVSLWAEVRLIPSPPEGDLRQEIRIENRDARPLSLSFLTGAEGWTVEPPALDLAPGGTGSVLVTGPAGEEAPMLLLLSEREDVPYLFPIGREEALSSPAPSDAPGEGYIFFYTPGCAICTAFYQELLPGLVEEYGLPGLPEKRNIYDAESFELMNRLLAARPSRGTGFPLLVAGDRVFRGEEGLFREYPAFLADPSAFSEPEDPGKAPAFLPDLQGLTVFLAGLLDGINPCAFTTLLFLISYLKLAGRRGRDILKIGGSFTLAVFLTYFLLGLGFFQMLRMAESFSRISRVIRIGMAGFLLILSGASLIDWVKIRRGQAGESLLQLSGGAKKRIRRAVRKSARSSWLTAAGFGAGVLISLYELGCTGQIYLPMIVYMVKKDPGFQTVAPLLLYNFAFILPLCGVFLLFYRGVDSRRLTEFFQKHLGGIKLATALLFGGMALWMLGGL